MPRSGPRPYVFERKAWHSDGHQAMRGSLVKEIFRVVNEIHSLATRKNREWQEKLPVVVLKAEEIMYSKANSEAEYMDLKTLRYRTNDAINTIIRRDESTETRKLLQPCIEAALDLGCTARTTLRSQRHCSPRGYLNSRTQETENTTQGNFVVNEHCLANYSGILKSATAKIGAIENSSYKINQIDVTNTSSNSLPRIGCDLSLRLGLLSTPCLSVGNCPTRGVEDSFFTFGVDPLNSSSKSKDWSVEGEHMIVDASMRKRKTVNGPPMDQQFHLASKLPYSHQKCRILDSAP